MATLELSGHWGDTSLNFDCRGLKAIARLLETPISQQPKSTTIRGTVYLIENNTLKWNDSKQTRTYDSNDPIPLLREKIDNLIDKNCKKKK